MNIYLMNILSAAAESTPTVRSGMAEADILATVNIFVNILVNIVVIVGGVLGFNYIRKLREKQNDAVFSYLMKLNVRLKYFREILIRYEEDIMERYFPKGFRRGTSVDRTVLVRNTIKQLADRAEETLIFLQNEDNQLPAQDGWINSFNCFIDFLIDCEQLDQEEYFKWMESDDMEDKKKQYYDNVIKHIDILLKMVNERQLELEDEIFKKM